MNNCRDCKWFFTEYQHWTEGVCRRHAPMVLTKRCEHEANQVQWPPVNSGDWCGDFEPKEKEKSNDEL